MRDEPHLGLVEGDKITLRTGEIIKITEVDLPLIMGLDGNGEVFMTTEAAVASIEKAPC